MSDYKPEEGHLITATLGETVVHGLVTACSTDYNGEYYFDVKVGEFVDIRGETVSVELSLEVTEGWKVERMFNLPDQIGALVTCMGHLYVRNGGESDEYRWTPIDEDGIDMDYVSDDFFKGKKFIVHYDGIKPGVAPEVSDDIAPF